MQRQRFGQDLADRHARVKRRIRILEDDLRIAAEGAQLRWRQMRADRGPRSEFVPASGSISRSSSRLDSGFAAAGFADQRQRLAGIDAEAHAIDRLDERGRSAEHRARGNEMLHQAFDLEQRGHPPPRGRAVCSSGRARMQRDAVSPRRLMQRDQWPAALDGRGRRFADEGATGGEAAAGRRTGHVRAPCPRWWRDARRAGRAAGSSRAGRRCRDAAGCANSSSTGARSTISPAYITATSSQTSATTPRS